MSCSEIKIKGTDKCGNFKPYNPIKGIEVIFITNKEVELFTVTHDGTKYPITQHGDVSLVINNETFRFEKMDGNVFRTTKELF